jgi:hypothetical protein
MMESRLEEALRCVKLNQQRYVDYQKNASRKIEKALEYRGRARNLRGQRNEYFAKVVDDYIAERGADGQENDRKTLNSHDYTIEQQEKMRVRFIQDFIIWATNRVAQEDVVTARINNIINSHTDTRWTGYIVDGGCVGPGVYESLQDRYSPPILDYRYDNADTAAQTDRLNAVFGQASDLLTASRIAD